MGHTIHRASSNLAAAPNQRAAFRRLVDVNINIENQLPENTIPDVDDIPMLSIPFDPADETAAPASPDALPTAFDLDPKNPVRGLSKLDKLAAQLELERAREARYKAQKEAKEAKQPRSGMRPDTKAHVRQITDATKRYGDVLLRRYVYFGKNLWMARRGSDWSRASFELDGTVIASIRNAGYMDTPMSDFTSGTVWTDDPILRHADRRCNLTEVDFVLQYLKHCLFVDEVWKAAHWSHGVVSYNGKKILNRAAYKMVEPVGTSIPECWKVYVTGLFRDQSERVVGLWRETLKKVKGGGLNSGWFQPAGLILASNAGGVGKSRWFYFLARSFGADCPASAGGYLAGDVLGCSHLLQQPVVELSDASVPDRDVPQAQTKLLNLISNPMKEIRLMRTETKLVPLSPMVCVSLNSDNLECTKLFSGWVVTLMEKWIVIACGNGTRALRDAGFDYSDLERTLPDMIGYLLNSITPDEYLHEVVDGRRQPARFLVGHYFDPGLDLEWGPLGDMAPIWEDIQVVVKSNVAQPKDGWYKVSQLRTLLLTIRDSNCDPSYRDMTVKETGVVLGKLHGAIPSVLQRKALGDPKNGGRYVYRIV